VSAACRQSSRSAHSDDVIGVCTFVVPRVPLAIKYRVAHRRNEKIRDIFSERHIMTMTPPPPWAYYGIDGLHEVSKRTGRLYGGLDLING
jgi:hypothetical protein